MQGNVGEATHHLFPRYLIILYMLGRKAEHILTNKINNVVQD